MGGTGSKQEDQIITAAIEQGTGAEFTYVPFKGGGDVAAAVVGGHVNSSVNNPIEQVSHWQGGATRPLCVFGAERIDGRRHRRHVGRHPDLQGSRRRRSSTRCCAASSCRPASTRRSSTTTSSLFEKVRETPEWKDFMAKGAFTTTFMSGDEYKAWVGETAELHKDLMTNAGFLAPSEPASSSGARTRAPERSSSRVSAERGRSQRGPRTRPRSRAQAGSGETPSPPGSWSSSSRASSWSSPLS